MGLDLLLDAMIEHVALLVEDKVVGVAVVLFIAELGDVVVLDLRDGVGEPKPHVFDRDIKTDLLGRLELGAAGPAHRAWGVHVGDGGGVLAVNDDLLRESGSGKTAVWTGKRGV